MKLFSIAIFRVVIFNGSLTRIHFKWVDGKYSKRAGTSRARQLEMLTFSPLHFINILFINEGFFVKNLKHDFVFAGKSVLSTVMLQ